MLCPHQHSQQETIICRLLLATQMDDDDEDVNLLCTIVRWMAKGLQMAETMGAWSKGQLHNHVRLPCA